MIRPKKDCHSCEHLSMTGSIDRDLAGRRSYIGRCDLHYIWVNEPHPCKYYQLNPMIPCLENAIKEVEKEEDRWDTNEKPAPMSEL